MCVSAKVLSTSKSSIHRRKKNEEIITTLLK